MDSKNWDLEQPNLHQSSIPSTNPSDLTSSPTTRAYPKHLEERKNTFSHIQNSSVDSGSAHDSSAGSLRPSAGTRRPDVHLLGVKAYNAEENTTTEEAQSPVRGVFDMCRYRASENEDEEFTSTRTIKQNSTPLVLHQPTWTHIRSAEFKCPSLSVAAIYRSVLSGSHSRTGVYKRLPDNTVVLLAEGRRLGGSIEHFTAMAKVVRKRQRKWVRDAEGDEDYEEEEVDD